MRFTEDHARKLATLLFPHDVFTLPCTSKCEACDSLSESWEMKVGEVLQALKVLERFEK